MQELKMKSRQTKQKELLEKTLNGMKGFFTAEEFFAKSKIQNQGIGIATIYRYLAEQEKIHTLHTYVCNRKKVYSRHSNNHCHFICETCGARKHIAITHIDALRAQITGDICHFQIDIYGICATCKKLTKDL